MGIGHLRNDRRVDDAQIVEAYYPKRRVHHRARVARADAHPGAAHKVVVAAGHLADVTAKIVRAVGGAPTAAGNGRKLNCPRQAVAVDHRHGEVGHVEEGVKIGLDGEVVGVDQRRAGRVCWVQADCAARARPRKDRVQGEVVADLLEGRPEVAPFGPGKFWFKSFRKK